MYLVKFSGVKSSFIEAHSAKKAIHGILPIKPILEPMCIMKPKKKRRRRSAPHWAESQVPTRCNTGATVLSKICSKPVSKHFQTHIRLDWKSYQRCIKFVRKKGKSGQKKGQIRFRATKNLEATEASRFFLVRGTGLEPVTPCTSSMCSTS